MIHYRDFVPQQLAAPSFFSPGNYESLDAALAEANAWVHESGIRVINIETVVLPNIWSRYEEGSGDTALGASGESPSHWHQFIRVWYDG